MSQATVTELRLRLAEARVQYEAAEQCVANLKMEMQKSEAEMYHAYERAYSFAQALRALGEPDTFSHRERDALERSHDRAMHRRDVLFRLKLAMDSVEQVFDDSSPTSTR